MGKEKKYKTLAQARKDYPDAILITLKHELYNMDLNLIKIGENINYKGKSKVLYYKLGKRVSRVISSRKAHIESQIQLIRDLERKGIKYEFIQYERE